MLEKNLILNKIKSEQVAVREELSRIKMEEIMLANQQKLRKSYQEVELVQN